MREGHTNTLIHVCEHNDSHEHLTVSILSAMCIPLGWSAAFVQNWIQTSANTSVHTHTHRSTNTPSLGPAMSKSDVHRSSLPTMCTGSLPASTQAPFIYCSISSTLTAHSTSIESRGHDGVSFSTTHRGVLHRCERTGERWGKTRRVADGKIENKQQSIT